MTNNTNTTSYPFDDPMYTNGQTIFLEIVPYLTATPSVIGSSLIIWSIWCSRKVSMRIAYHRLMLAISILDLFVSLSLVVLGPWVVPSEVGFTKLGRGTFETCEIAGFFLNLTFGIMWLAGFLSLYFLLTLRFQWKERTIALVLEPPAYFTGFIYPVASGSYGLVKNSFNPMRELPGWCWYMDYPPYCSTLREGAPECERGENYNEASGIGNAGTVLFLLGAIVFSMTLIVLKVRSTERQLRQYASGQLGNLRRTRETSWQAILYIASFFAVYFPIVMLNVLGNRKTDPDHNAGALFTFALLAKTTSPMQGLFNAYIYLRKKFWRLTKVGESFAFMRQIPFLGTWVSEKSDSINSRASSGYTHQTHGQQQASMQPQHSHQVLTRKQYASTVAETMVPNSGDMEQIAPPTEQKAEQEAPAAPPRESERTLKDEPSDRKVVDG